MLVARILSSLIYTSSLYNFIYIVDAILH